MGIRKFYLFHLLINIIFIVGINSKFLCPKQCRCLFENGYRLAKCTNGNIADVNLEIPNVAEVYDLTGNSISKLEDYCFKNMGLTSLVKINLSNNIIFWIALHALAGLEELEELNLSKNRLQSFSPDLFWYNTKLENLDLSGNKLWDLNNEAFLTHNNLKILNLKNSQISHIPDKMFSGLPNLENLDLSNNYMINLKASVLIPLKNLKIVNLNDNQWTCNDVFINLQAWMSSQKIIYERQCINDKMKPKMFEKMILLEPADDEKEREIEDLDESWENHKESNKSNITVQSPSMIVHNFTKTFPLITLIIGFFVGMLFGMLFSYCWLTQFCKHACCNIGRRKWHRSTEARDQLLSPNTILMNSESTPVIMRRQLSSSNSFSCNTSWELQNRNNEHRRPPMILDPPIISRAIFGTSTLSESPPPTYRECLYDSVVGTES